MREISWSAALEIHSLKHAQEQLSHLAAGGADVLLKSPEGALSNTGSRYWLALLTQLQATFPTFTLHLIVDAGDASGLAQGAIADGHRYIRFTGNNAVKNKLQKIATASGCTLL